MSNKMVRRDLLKLVSLGGVVFASALLRGATGCANGGSGSPAPGKGRGASEDFFFLQLSDTHWGFTGPANPKADVELENAVAAINAAAAKPDFVVFTGDLTHKTDDPALRRRRMTEFKQIVSALAVPAVKLMPGEHDAAADGGAIYKELFGDLHYAFDHKGIHFVALDNVSDPRARLGDTQLDWLRADLQRLDPEAPIVVFAHRPLWDLRPDWEWNTPDGAKAIELLTPHHNVTVFFGHIHQELHHTTGHIEHHAARSLMFALPAPGSPGQRAPLPWDAAHPDGGLGWRSVQAAKDGCGYKLAEIPEPHERAG